MSEKLVIINAQYWSTHGFQNDSLRQENILRVLKNSYEKTDMKKNHPYFKTFI